MDFSIRLYNRDFSTRLAPPRIDMEVTSYSFSYRGGPDLCNFTCWGPDTELWLLTDNLRCPVEVLDSLGNKVWWGYIHKITVHVGAINVGLSLENMNNRVSVTYSLPGADTRSDTNWSYDYDSVGVYGTKEMMLSLGTGGSAQADMLRDIQLAERRYPTPVVEHQPGQSSYSATVECRGWWSTLDWLYYKNQAGEESYTYEGLGTQYFGDVASAMEVRQGFQLIDGTDTWPCDHVEVKMRKANNPDSAVRVTISTSTNTILTTGSTAASNIGPNHAWISFPLDNSAIMSPSNAYWLRVHAGSTACPSDFYVVNTNQELSYPRGIFRVWNKGSNTWTLATPDADMEFRVLGVTETSGQLLTTASRAGQFFTNVVNTTSTSVYTTPYRDGTQLGMSVIDALLDTGTACRRRVRSYVDDTRSCIFQEEPEYTSPSLFMSTDGQLRDRLSNPVSYLCPVGDWCVLKDVFPKTFDDTYITAVGKFFIERVTYNVQDNSLRIEPRAGAEKFALVKDG